MSKLFAQVARISCASEKGQSCVAQTIHFKHFKQMQPDGRAAPMCKILDSFSDDRGESIVILDNADLDTHLKNWAHSWPHISQLQMIDQK